MDTPPTFTPRSDLVRLLVERGHLYQATDLEGLDAAALKEPISAYIGFDATAPRACMSAAWCRS